MPRVTSHDQDKYRAAASDGLCMGMGIRIPDPAPGAEDFMGASLPRLAQLCLERNGQNQRMASPNKIAKEAITMSRRAMGTDDFSSIMRDVQHKTLLAAYDESPKTFLPITRVTTTSDFKSVYGVALSESPDLDLLNEHEEYKHAHFKDKQESYSVKKYGKIVWLSLEAIVNDDKRALTRIPQLFGNAAARAEGDLVWSIITGNPVMNEDGKALFHADHNNLETVDANKGTVSPDRVSRGRAAMRKQTGPNGAVLNLMPTFILVPAAQETDGEILARSASLPVENMPQGTYNYSRNLVPIAEPRLDAASEKAWYLAASPSQVDIIEMAFLEGEQRPTVEEDSDFYRDAIGTKCRHTFGAGPMDFRGLWKNPGE